MQDTLYEVFRRAEELLACCEPNEHENDQEHRSDGLVHNKDGGITETRGAKKKCMPVVRDYNSLCSRQKLSLNLAGIERGNYCLSGMVYESSLPQGMRNTLAHVEFNTIELATNSGSSQIWKKSTLLRSYSLHSLPSNTADNQHSKA